MATSTALKAGGRTGGKCPATGPYYSGRNARITVLFAKGQTFPPDADGNTTTWTLVTETVMTTNAQFLQAQ
jgi:hypothetical protein